MFIKQVFMLICCITPYVVGKNSIDVVIPCHEKDARTLNLAIKGIKTYGKDIGRVIVVSHHRLADEAEWFDEANYPFTKKTLALALFKGNQEEADDYSNRPDNRMGWIYQQLLKLYAPLLIPGISENVLVLDADTIFLNTTEFIDNQGYALYNVGRQNTKAYFDHGQRLLPGFKRIFEHYSGICNYMLFQQPVIKQLFKKITSVHGLDPWQAICECIDSNDIFACFSEYEIYFNFVFSKKNKVKIRKLQWKDMAFNTRDIATLKKQGYHYVSCHTWIG